MSRARVIRRASTMRDGRTDAKYLDGARIEYTARRCGHVYVIDHSKGKAPRGAWTPGMASHLVKRWAHGGCIAVCPVCVKEGKR
jgi:hypothetical protein